MISLYSVYRITNKTTSSILPCDCYSCQVQGDQGAYSFDFSNFGRWKEVVFSNSLDKHHDSLLWFQGVMFFYIIRHMGIISSVRKYWMTLHSLYRIANKTTFGILTLWLLLKPSTKRPWDLPSRFNLLVS